MSFKDGASSKKKKENILFLLGVTEQQFERMNVMFGEV